MADKKQLNRLTLGDQLKIVEFLKKGEPWVDVTYDHIARECEKELQFPITSANVLTVAKAAEIKIGKSDPQDKVVRTIVSAIYGPYQCSAYEMPKDFADLVKSLAAHR